MVGEIFNRILNTLDDVLSIKELPNIGVLPPPVVTLSQSRAGMAVDRAWGKILEFKKEKGLPTGTLADGSDNIDDMMWRILIEAIMEEIYSHSKITTAISPGVQIVGTGIGNLGLPVVVYGATTSFGIGGTIIE